MRTALIALLIAGCTHIPPELIEAKASVDNRLQYAYFTGNNRPAHLEPHQTNCVGFSKAYEAELQQQGKLAVRFLCKTPSGQAHMAVLSEGYVLDNRYSMPVPIDGYDCKPI